MKQVLRLIKELAPGSVEYNGKENTISGVYRLSDLHIGAIQAAYFSKRPLLVKGDPGTGKTTLALALAHKLEWGFVKCVVNHDSSIDDMLYSIDHLQRLQDANTVSQCPDEQRDLRLKPVSDYVRPGKIWQALAPDRLEEFGVGRPHDRPGTVLLIDEIDKADSSLPNALLEVLDTGEISVPQVKDTVKSRIDHPVFVVITSNGERLLPPAFLRRCAVLDLSLPSEADECVKIMLEICETHMASGLLTRLDQEKILISLAEFIAARRDVSSVNYRPGPSEFLDIVRALSVFPEGEREQKLEVMRKHLADKV